jgi:hypothetical protein
MTFRQKTLLMAIAMLLTLSISSLPIGANQKSVLPGSEPGNRKRSCIQAVDGYAYLSEDMTLAETREAAFSNAKRQAVEMAKTYISTRTKVVNLETEYDIILSKSEGAVSILEQKDLGVEKNTRYHVWIKAEVEYSVVPKSGLDIAAALENKNAPLTVKIWTAKKQYRRGEVIQIFMQGNRDYYARIININTEGNIIQLLPNDFKRRNSFNAGKIYRIQDTGDRFVLRASPPYGRDRIIIYASEAPLGDVAMEAVGQGLNRFRGNVGSLAAKPRGIQLEPDTSGSTPAASFYEGVWTFMTGQ